MVIKIRLVENPSTGYRWHVTEVPKFAVSLGDNFEPTPHEPSPHILCGAGGTRIFSFGIPEDSTGDIKFVHARAWNKEKDRINELIVTIDREDEIS